MTNSSTKITARRIKGFKDYLITEQGDLFSYKQGRLKKLKPHFNKKDERYRTTIINDEGEKISILIAVLMVKTFKRVKFNSDKHVIVYKDGNPHNVELSNLDVKLLKHTKQKGLIFKVADSEDGKPVTITGIRKLAKYINTSTSSIIYHIRKNNSNNKKFKCKGYNIELVSEVKLND